MEKKPTTTDPATRSLDSAASQEHRHEPPNIRGITREDVEYTASEVKEMLSRLGLHQEEKDMLISRASRKLEIWRRALES